jgi:DNA-binding MarR family transcriptional regulator
MRVVTTRAELDRKLLAATERLGRALRAARQHLATRHRVSLLQLQVLELLADQRPRRVGELAAELDVSQPTTSDALATLSTKGLVARLPHPTDARVGIVALTDAGANLAGLIAVELAPLVAGDDATTDDDHATALRVLLTEISRLQHAGIITINRSCLTCQHYRPSTTPAPAHCHLLDQPLADRDLRVDCPEYANAT